jgi:hypothetical protein
MNEKTNQIFSIGVHAGIDVSILNETKGGSKWFDVQGSCL